MSKDSAVGKQLKIVLVEWRPDNNLFKDSLGIQYIASALRKENYAVEIIVCEANPLDTVVSSILAAEPDVVGIQLYSTNPEESFTIAQRVKERRPGTSIVLGGHAATLHGMRIMHQREFVDFIIYGEGEITFCDLCRRIENKLDFFDCNGIFFRANGDVFRTPRREQIQNLDELPFPVLDLQKKEAEGRSSVLANIQTARGCMGGCAFCVETRIIDKRRDRRWRGRTAENIVEEMEYIKSCFPGKRLAFAIIDSSFEDPDPGRKTRIRRFAELLKEKNIQCAFSFFTRADSWSEEDRGLIELLRSAGLFKVQVGFESGSDAILDIFNKKADVADNLRVACLFREQDVNVFGFVIMFHPYVSLQDLRTNANFLKQVEMAYCPEMWFHKVDLHHDAKIFQQIASDGLLRELQPGGYYFSYGFVDGNVSRLSKVMEQLGKMDGPFVFHNTTVKIDNELLLFNVWKKYYQDLAEIEPEMDEYRKSVAHIYRQAGDKQYELFHTLLDSVEEGALEMAGEKIIYEWNAYLKGKSNELEIFWMRNRMRCARKKIQLI